MTDYDNLVAALRCRATRDWTNCGNCKYADEDDDPRGCWGTVICADAADAIEALNHLVDLNMERCEALREQLRKAHENYEKHLNELEAQMPKRGKWKTTRPDAPMFGFYYCSICGRRRTSPQDNYCPNCGADMRAKMEVHE